jgi:hypothetical protein
VVFLSTSATTASFQVLSNALFITHFTIFHYVVYAIK